LNSRYSATNFLKCSSRKAFHFLVTHFCSWAPFSR